MDFIPGGGELRSGEDRLAMGSGGLLLAQNTPNPFNPSTQIRFSIPSAGPVSLRVYDIIGQEIATLLDEHQPAGEHTVSFEGTGLPSGIYMYRLQHDSGVRVGRMILAR
jgi:hypothetical protein